MTFDRPIGAQADVIELEYVSALHQTDVQNGIRKDGSIKDDDVSLFLASRYGVKQTPEEVFDKIFRPIGSTDGYLDLMQIASLLLIPILQQDGESDKHNNNNNNNNVETTEKTTSLSNIDDETIQQQQQEQQDFIELSLEMLLLDVTNDRNPPELTSTLIRQILHALGETELAENEMLISLMLQQAGGDVFDRARSRVVFDSETFRRALTSDIRHFNFDIYNNNNKSKPKRSNFHNILLASSSVDNATPSTDNDDGDDDISLGFQNIMAMESMPSMINREKTVKEIPITYTAPQLDEAAETIRSRPKVVLQWLFFLLSFQTYLFRYISDDFFGLSCKPYNPKANIIENFGKFACLISVNVLQWIVIMIFMSCCGLVYFSFGGFSNSVECCNPIFAFTDIIVALVTTFLPWFFLGRQSPWQDLSSMPSARAYIDEFLEAATLVFGACTVFISMWEFSSMLTSRDIIVCDLQKSAAFVPDMVKVEARIMRAATFKVDTMIKNAVNIHRTKQKESVVPTHFGQALLNFTEREPEKETMGGFIWLWRLILSDDLSSREGVLLFSRLLSANLTQIAVIPFVLIGGGVLTFVAKDEFESFIYDIDSELNTYGIHLDLVTITENSLLAITRSLASGTVTAALTAFAIASATIPSAVSTIIKLRCGVIPFVKDPTNLELRIAPDQVAYLKGIMFWGCIFASIAMGTLMTIMVFVFVWEVTAATAQNILAVVLGALVALTVNVIITKSLRRVSSQAFYRYRPAVANMTALARECGFLALTQGFVFFRIFKLMIAAILYIGRVDAPFLHEDRAHAAGLRLDGEPYMFLIDVLLHEAHRHPYIESLGTMYLLKLKHTEKEFINQAGSTWRLILVYVLMPWLAKYRAIRRQFNMIGETENKDSFSGPPGDSSFPTQAVSLYDPQAYTLRMASMVPVAQGWAGSLALTQAFDDRRSLAMGILPSLAEQGNIMEDEEETEELQRRGQGLNTALRLVDDGIPPPPTPHGANIPPVDTTSSGQINKPPASQQQQPPPSSHNNGAPQKEGQRTSAKKSKSDERKADVLPPMFGRALKSSLLLKRKDSVGLTGLRPPRPRKLK